MSNTVYKKTIGCPNEDLNFRCEDRTIEHYVSIEFNSTGVKIIQKTCDNESEIFFTDESYQAFTALLAVHFNEGNWFPHDSHGSLDNNKNQIRPNCDNFDYLRGFVDGYGGEEPHDCFPDGFKGIREVMNRMDELDVKPCALNGEKEDIISSSSKLIPEEISFSNPLIKEKLKELDKESAKKLAEIPRYKNISFKDFALTFGETVVVVNEIDRRLNLLKKCIGNKGVEEFMSRLANYAAFNTTTPEYIFGEIDKEIMKSKIN